MSSHPRHRQELSLLQRRKHVAELYISGKRQWEIGQQLGVDASLVSRDLRAIQTFWLETLQRHYSQHQADALARIDRVEREAWESWEASKHPREVTETEHTDGGELIDLKTGTRHAQAARRKARVRREAQTGHAVYLQVVQKCIDQRISILGLAAATKHKIDLDLLTTDQLRLLAQGEHPDRVRAEKPIIDVTPH